MELVLLGTGSADGWPNPFCMCASCVAAKHAVPVHTRTWRCPRGISKSS